MATSKLLSEKERSLIAATSKKRLAKLDADGLVELHEQVRRARNKYLKLYRRQAGNQVDRDRARGVAATRNQRTSQKAEVFEDALSAVSAQLAVASKGNAAKLRKERQQSEAAIAKQQAKKKAEKKKAAARQAADRKAAPAKKKAAAKKRAAKKAAAKKK